MKVTPTFFVISFMVGPLTHALGFPVFVDGTFSLRFLVIGMLINAMFYLTLNAEKD